MGAFFKSIGVYMSIIMLIFCALSGENAEKNRKEIFAEMLNANYAAECDFESERDLFISSLIALRDSADSEGYIPRAEVDRFMLDMYGINSENLEVQTLGEREEKCFILIPPMGYDELSYEITEINKTETGYAAEVIISVNPHDSDEYFIPATAYFEKSEKSAYGFILTNIDE